MINDRDDAGIDRPPRALSSLMLPGSLVLNTIRGLRGYAPYEGLCYWFGRELQPGIAIAMVAAFPRISSTERSFWLLEGELSRLLEWADREQLWLLAQVHTHPADEPHSPADQQWAPTYRPGFVSVIFPFSAQFATLREPGWRCFACDAEGAFVPAHADLLHIFDDVRLSQGNDE